MMAHFNQFRELVVAYGWLKQIVANNVAEAKKDSPLIACWVDNKMFRLDAKVIDNANEAWNDEVIFLRRNSASVQP